jgi:hypothetical protein
VTSDLSDPCNAPLGALWRRDGKETFYFAPNTGTGLAASVDGRGAAFNWTAGLKR